MDERHVGSLHEAAIHLLDTLISGGQVTLDITAQDAATGALLRLITEIHDAARYRHVGIAMEPLGTLGLRLTLADP
ncbi:MAG: hypothetical protein ACR2OO_06210 [Thermomicrobiales bacterium]